MDKMDDTKTVDVPVEQVKEQKPTDTGDVQIENASPQVPETETQKVPAVEHKDDSARAGAGAAKKDGKDRNDKAYPGGERFDAAALPQSNDADEIRKQVEFYFSDSNLPTDKYLWTMVSENKGWADLTKIATFKRMRRFQPYSAIVEALRSSTFLDIDESGERVKRKEELKPWTAATTPVLRSVHVKGFPEETKTMQVDLEKFFAGFGDAKVVRMRRTDDGLFKGSVFVEFATTEQQAAFLALEGEQKPKFEGAELESVSKKAYLTMKEEQYGGQFPANKRSKSKFNAFSEQKKQQPARQSGRSGRGRGQGNSKSARTSGRPNDRNAEKQAQEPDNAPAHGEKRPHAGDGKSNQAKQQKTTTVESS